MEIFQIKDEFSLNEGALNFNNVAKALIITTYWALAQKQ